MRLFTRIILGLFLFTLGATINQAMTKAVKAKETKEDICIYVMVKEGNTLKLTNKLGNCSANSKTIITINQNKETI